LRKLFIKPNTANGGAEDDYKKYPFFSKRIDMPKQPGGGPTYFNLSAGTLVIDIYPLAVAANQMSAPLPYTKANLDQKIQSLTIHFAPVTLQAPLTGNKPLGNADASVPNVVRIPDTAKSEDNGGIRGMTVPLTAPYIDSSKDTVRSMEINGITKGDNRLVAGLINVTDDYFSPSGNSQDYSDKNQRIVHNFRSGWGAAYPDSKWGHLVPAKNPTNEKYPAAGLSLNNIDATDRIKDKGGKYYKIPDVPRTIEGVFSVDGSTRGDFDRGFSKQLDGPFINKPDEGNTKNDPADDFAGGGGLAYFRGDNGTEVVGDKYFSPNRIIPSAAMFGSLPSGLFSKRPWETLLFCPSVSAKHKGAVSPADHYLLDLFSMPVVEPFAISEPLSTMGRINLNARLAPFGYAKDKKTGRSYIERNTGLHAVLKGMKQFIAANNTTESGHAEKPLTGSTNNMEFRFDIDPYQTIEKAIAPRFDVGGNGYFKCASEICDIDLLITKGQAFDDPAKRKGFWDANSMTGDNARERPYAMIYPRLTTKSNVYTVHVWAQSVLKNPNSYGDDWKRFDENRDRVTGEYRGSTAIERFLDPNDPALVPAAGGGKSYDAVDDNAKGLDPYYRFRILSSKRFTMQ